MTVSDHDLDELVGYLCWKGNQRWDDVERWTAQEIVDRVGVISGWVAKENEANKGNR